MTRMTIAALALALSTLPFTASAQEDPLTHRSIDGGVLPKDYHLTDTSLEICWDIPSSRVCRTFMQVNINGCPQNTFQKHVLSYLDENFDNVNTANLKTVGDFQDLRRITTETYIAVTECHDNGRPTGIYAILFDHRKVAAPDNFKPDALFRVAGVRD